jgi:gas vesicle protein
MDNSKNLAWFIAGASVGAAIALLFAPQSGEETRRYIGDQARKGRDKATDLGKEAWDRGRDLFDRGRDLADDAAEMVGERVENVRREFRG